MKYGCGPIGKLILDVGDIIYELRGDFPKRGRKMVSELAGENTPRFLVPFLDEAAVVVDTGQPGKLVSARVIPPGRVKLGHMLDSDLLLPGLTTRHVIPAPLA